MVKLTSTTGAQCGRFFRWRTRIHEELEGSIDISANECEEEAGDAKVKGKASDGAS